MLYGKKTLIGIVFLAKHTFFTNDVGSRRRWNKDPSTIGHESIILFLHG
jgi:hypothetical protein